MFQKKTLTPHKGKKGDILFMILFLNRTQPMCIETHQNLTKH